MLLLNDLPLEGWMITGALSILKRDREYWGPILRRYAERTVGDRSMMSSHSDGGSKSRRWPSHSGGGDPEEENSWATIPNSRSKAKAMAIKNNSAGHTVHSGNTPQGLPFTSQISYVYTYILCVFIRFTMQFPSCWCLKKRLSFSN